MGGCLGCNGIVDPALRGDGHTVCDDQVAYHTMGPSEGVLLQCATSLMFLEHQHFRQTVTVTPQNGGC